MPVDWHTYDQFFQAGPRGQRPIDLPARADVERLVADIVGLSTAQRAERWGAASPPGRFAQTVVELDAGLEAGAAELVEGCARLGVSRLAVKVFKANQDAAREASRAIDFHLARIRDGWPMQSTPNIQKVAAAGWREDRHGQRRGYVIQEWIAGRTLEDAHSMRYTEPFTEVFPLLASLYLDLVLPVWWERRPGSGVMWDWRDAQVVISVGDTPRLALIDTDALRELRCQRSSQQRARQERLAFSRLRAMTARLLDAPRPPDSAASLRRAVGRAWQTADLGGYDETATSRGLLPGLATGDRGPSGPKQAQASIRLFLDALASGITASR